MYPMFILFSPSASIKCNTILLAIKCAQHSSALHCCTVLNSCELDKPYKLMNTSKVYCIVHIVCKNIVFLRPNLKINMVYWTLCWNWLKLTLSQSQLQSQLYRHLHKGAWTTLCLMFKADFSFHKLNNNLASVHLLVYVLLSQNNWSTIPLTIRQG